jgi:hypothetical protein
MKKDNVKIKKPLTEEQLNEFIGTIAKWIFGRKSKVIMHLAAKDPRFKSALEDYVSGTQEFRKKLKDIYGTTDLDKLPKI